MAFLSKGYNGFVKQADRLQPLVLLLMRLAIAYVFFSSGLTKIHDFSNTVYLFANEYKTPVLPPYAAAVLSTTFELGCPLLLTLGLAARLAALPLLGMTAVIQFTYDQNIQHGYWALLLLAILAFGPGKWSCDQVLLKQKGMYA